MGLLLQWEQKIKEEIEREIGITINTITAMKGYSEKAREKAEREKGGRKEGKGHSA